MENIIFVHKGSSFYLPLTLANAHRFNPNHKIWLISDIEPAPECQSYVEYVPIDSFSASINLLAENYLHVARSEVSFEKFCFERWLIMAELMKRFDLNRICHLDSDVLIFENITGSFDSFKEYDFTLSRQMSGHNSFWLNPKALDEFTRYFMGLYLRTDHALIDKFTSDINESLKISGTNWGMSDMYFLGSFAAQNKYKFFETTTIVQNTTYDNNINVCTETTPEFKKDPGRNLKLITWKGGLPHATRLDTGEYVRLKTIHFQGVAKFELPEYYAASLYSSQISNNLMIDHPQLCHEINTVFSSDFYKS